MPQMPNTQPKKALFFNPYLDSAGGGERYFFAAAAVLANLGWQVDITGSRPDRARLADQLKIDLASYNFLPDVFKYSAWHKFRFTRGYDLIFYISDGSIPLLAGRRNLLHFQVPFQGVNGRSPANRFKLGFIHHLVCNSRFTQRFVDREFGSAKTTVLYPPVDTTAFKPLAKKKIILYVGRFTDLLHHKNQELLADIFMKLYTDHRNGPLKNWQLVLAGGDKEGKAIVTRLRSITRGYPVRIAANVDFSELKLLYGQASLFWSAAGFGFNELKEPQKMEHFGMTTVEAMAAGAVPLVVNLGGQKEIVTSGEDGYVWKTTDQLQNLTLDLIRHPAKRRRLAAQAIITSQRFSLAKFNENFKQIVQSA